MHYMTLSFTHKNTDISVREKLSFSNSDRLHQILTFVIEHEDIDEVMILSTGNRVEIIANVFDCARAKEHILRQIVNTCNIKYDDIDERVDVYEDDSS